MTLVGACTQGDEVDEDFSATDESGKSDGYGNTKLVGTVELGFGRRVLYKQTPRYRAVKFHAEAGTMLEVYVRSTQGDPVTWLTDANLNIVAFSDDANEETNSNISIESLAATGDYYIVFRDKHLESHYFDVAPVQLNKPANAPAHEDVKAEYERLVNARTLASAQIATTGLPFLAKGLYDRYKRDAAGAPGTQVAAYALQVSGQTVWLVRKYLPGSGMEAISYCESGPMISVCGGTSELMESCEY